MRQVVQVPCPGCNRVLRFPAEWVKESLRCKHCGTVVRAKQKPAPAQPAAQPEPARVVPEVVSPAPQALPAAPLAPAPSNGFTTSHPLQTAFAEMLPAEPETAPSPSAGGEPIIRTARFRRRSRVLQLATVVVGVLFLAGAAYQFWPQLSRLRLSLSVLPAEDSPDPEPGVPSVNPVRNSDLPAGGIFPRRALAIAVNNYLYANPVSYGSGDYNVHALMQKIARVLHVQPSQIVELSDTTPPKPRVKPPGKQGDEKPAASTPAIDLEATARLPLKPVIEQTISSFLETSRAQDRILMLFAGHVVEIGEETYLVPLEGEPTVKETLIPLTWLYERLAQCKARQKVLILDTCRFDPSRGLERPGSGPMKAKLDAVLQQPPAGVQLWSACVAGQYSYESDGSSLFLDKLCDALTAAVLKRIQQPQDPLPIETLAQVVNQSTAAEAAVQSASDGQQATQTPRLAGQAPADGAPYDQHEPLPPAIEIAIPPPPPGGMAKRDEVRSILQEIDLPPIKLARGEHTPLEIDALAPFSAQVIERYRPDYRSLKEIHNDAEKYPLRAQVLETVKVLRANFDPKGPQGSLREYFQGGNSDQIKAEIFKEQMKPARVLGELTEWLEELRKAGEERDQEPSQRWQAHYDYMLAQLLARTAYVSEYNLMLGKIRKDELPELRPKVHTGWRLASQEKLQSGKDVKDMAAESRKIFAKLIKDHPGTPWGVLAKRERLTALGLRWEPSR